MEQESELVDGQDPRMAEFEAKSPTGQQAETETAHTAALADQANISNHERAIDRITGKIPELMTETVQSVTASHIETIKKQIVVAQAFGRTAKIEELQAELDKFRDYQEGDRQLSVEALEDSVMSQLDTVQVGGTGIVYGVEQQDFDNLALKSGGTIELRATSSADAPNKRVFEIPSANISLLFDPDRRLVFVQKINRLKA